MTAEFVRMASYSEGARHGVLVRIRISELQLPQAEKTPAEPALASTSEGMSQ
jgi:hypothetical protein